MQKCPFCGVEDQPTHKKYTDRCDLCGSRYSRYTSYKSKQKKDFTWAREHKLDVIRYEYRELKKQGYKVPHDFQDPE